MSEVPLYGRCRQVLPLFRVCTRTYTDGELYGDEETVEDVLFLMSEVPL